MIFYLKQLKTDFSHLLPKTIDQGYLNRDFIRDHFYLCKIKFKLLRFYSNTLSS